jgi:LuxR family maltose regulon positive regulatory protein
MFVDEGSPMEQLLREAFTHQIRLIYTGKLLKAFEAERKQVAGESLVPTSPASQTPINPQAQPAKNMLVEPLSERELDVLRMFQTDLSGPEIAQELMIALSTVRTHTKSIFSKLNVNNRRAAVKRAAELHLI